MLIWTFFIAGGSGLIALLIMLDSCLVLSPSCTGALYLKSDKTQ
jgi:hypothetical protein